MDADSVTPNVTPEASPKPAEQVPAAAGEQLPTHGPERTPASPEKVAPSQGMSLPPVQPPAAGVVTSAPVVKTDDDDTDNPAIADDVDVIEMEWVNQAKKVIKETKDNPHAQEAAVEKLQRDYLKKRYGRELKTSSG